MSASSGCGDCVYGFADVPGCQPPCRKTVVQSFDLDAEFRRRFKLCDDDDEDDCAVSEYSDDYMSMTGSGASTTSTLPPSLLVERLATLSVSSGDSFSLYDPEDDDDDDDEDRCSISTLENFENADECTTNSQLPGPVRSGGVEEDREFDFLARSATTTTVCRSASLKSTYASKPPSSPHTKKFVRFADALGLDLESIRHILDFSDVPPESPRRTPSDFGHSDDHTAELNARMRFLVRFSEPGSSVNFLRRVQERKISLEEVNVDADRRTVSGIIRVANVADQKQVCI